MAKQGSTSGTDARGVAEFLRPAFKSNVTAVWFLVLIVFALLLPKIISSTGQLSRRNAYEILPERLGAYSFMSDEVFEKTEDLDILFVGTSIVWNAIDTPQVRQGLSEVLGRPARAVTFGYSFASMDTSYALLRDVLQRRRVGLVVLSIPRLTYTEGPSPTACKFLRYGSDSDVFKGLPLESKISLYACDVLRSPRDLLTLTRPNSRSRSLYTDTLGAFKRKVGMGEDPRTFERFAPEPPSLAGADMIYSDSTRELFDFTEQPIPEYQTYHLDRIIELLRKNGVPFAILNIPQYSERKNNKIVELRDWRTRFGADTPLIGIPPRALFSGLSEAEVEKLHGDHEHLNLNGCEFYTRAILPAILDVHSKHATKTF